MKVIIDLDHWGRGHGAGELLDESGRRCCLGFLARACGVPDEVATGKAMPSNCGTEYDWPAKLFDRAGWNPWWDGKSDRIRTTEDALAAINDCDLIDEPTREAWVAEGFRTALGVDVEFVGGDK